MHRHSVLLLLTVSVVLLPAIARAEEAVQGTTPEELAQLQLPQPTEVSVALLPFWDYKNLPRHVEVCRDHLSRYFSREGFTLVPPGLVSGVPAVHRGQSCGL